MDDIMSHIQMQFHPLSELDERFIEPSSILKRNHIHLLSYNIFIRPPPIKNNENDWKNERLIEFIKLIDNYDIICFQEMFCTFTSRRQEMIKYASKSGLFFSVDVPSPSYFSKWIIDSGLVILSRFPIIESEFRPFTYTVLSDSVVEKGILYAKIKIRDSFLVIFDTHFQATYFTKNEDEWDISSNTRIVHADELSKFVFNTIKERKITANDRILLVGDFNIDFHCLKNKINKLDEVFTFIVLDEYRILMEKLNEKFISLDLWKKIPNYKTHPFTYGVTGDENNPQYDMALTDKEDLGCNQTLDYIFEVYLNNEDLENSTSNKKLFIDYDSLKIEEFLVECKPFQTLSDHFGLSLNISYKNN